MHHEDWLTDVLTFYVFHLKCLSWWGHSRKKKNLVVQEVKLWIKLSQSWSDLVIARPLHVTCQPIKQAVGNMLGVSLSPGPRGFIHYLIGCWGKPGSLQQGPDLHCLVRRRGLSAQPRPRRVKVSQTMPSLCTSYCLTGNYQCKPGDDYSSLFLAFV